MFFTTSAFQEEAVWRQESRKRLRTAGQVIVETHTREGCSDENISKKKYTERKVGFKEESEGPVRNQHSGLWGVIQEFCSAPHGPHHSGTAIVQ